MSRYRLVPRLKEARQKAGLSSATLDKLAAFSSGRSSRLELGYADATEEETRLLAKLLKTDFDWLVEAVKPQGSSIQSAAAAASPPPPVSSQGSNESKVVSSLAAPEKPVAKGFPAPTYKAQDLLLPAPKVQLAPAPKPLGLAQAKQTQAAAPKTEIPAVSPLSPPAPPAPPAKPLERQVPEQEFLSNLEYRHLLLKELKNAQDALHRPGVPASEWASWRAYEKKIREVLSTTT